MERSILSYKELLPCLLMFVHSSCSSILPQATRQKNTTVDLPSFQLHLNGRGITDGGNYTVGNSLCRPDKKCGRHDGEPYSWCPTGNTWDYCCERACSFNPTNGDLTCYTGDHTSHCSYSKNRITVSKRNCRDDHICGSHGMHGIPKFWCYVDELGNFEYCCHPKHKCGNHSYSYNWCYSGFDFSSRWDYCTP